VEGGVEIRAAEPGDAAGIAGVHVASWLRTYADLVAHYRLDDPDPARREALWRGRLSEPTDPADRVFVATTAGGVTGFAWVTPSPDDDDDAARVGQVRSLHVSPDAQGRGTGRLLLRAALEHLAEAGRTAASLWVVADNHRARGVYEHLGWSPDGTSRREPLGVEGENAAEVTVMRYRKRLGRTGFRGVGEP
jgi:GNAT superfamily N-acetyltransferase